MKKKPPKRETSKVMLFITGIIAVASLLFAAVILYQGKPSEGLAYFIPSGCAPFATALGFYYWKARAENVIKLQHAQTAIDRKSRKRSPTEAVLSEKLRQILEESEGESV